MKKLFVMTIGSLFAASAFATATVSNVKARQRYPWNGMVDIDYTITGDGAGLTAEIKVEDLQNGKTYVPSKFLSVVPTSEGRHRVTWSTEAEGVTIISSNVTVTVSLVTPDPEAFKNDTYYVVDLSGGPTAERYPVTTLSAPPNTTWSDEYKTTKLVLRRIEAGADPLGRYTITKPFYIGVFEVTLKQWMLVMGAGPVSGFTYNTHGDKAAVCDVVYGMIRGSFLGAGWPGNSNVDATSFLGKLRVKTGVDFDLPTEGQWEYACRAGTISKYNNGGNTSSDLGAIGRYSGNKNDGRGGYSDVTTVGSYAPNDWGLYDMHGNVDEWCLDWFGTKDLSGSDPKGPSSSEIGENRVLRGGSYGDDMSGCASSWRYNYAPPLSNGNNPRHGFRLCCSGGL